MGELVTLDMDPSPVRYSIRESEYGKFYVWKLDGEKRSIMQTKPFSTFAEARQFVRNQAVVARAQKAFRAKEWVFSSEQAANSSVTQPEAREIDT